RRFQHLPRAAPERRRRGLAREGFLEQRRLVHVRAGVGGDGRRATGHGRRVTGDVRAPRYGAAVEPATPPRSRGAEKVVRRETRTPAASPAARPALPAGLDGPPLRRGPAALVAQRPRRWSGIPRSSASAS